MFRLSIETGLRSSELCNLKISELDFTNKVIVTRRKGGKRKPAFFGNPDIQALVKDWLEKRKGIAKSGIRELFVNIEGRHKGLPVKPDRRRIICRRLAIKAGIEHFSPHSLRRSFACIATQLGGPTHVIMKAGGWNDLNQVKRYTKNSGVEEFGNYSPSIALAKYREGSVPADPSRGSDSA
jgi:integrase/recombinase XerD